MSKILVTGSKGTIGIPLVKELLKNGHEVWENDLMHHLNDNYIRADISHYRQVERLFDNEYDYVYHLAAEFGRINGEEYFENLWATNVIGTRNILEFQKKRGFKLIFASSSEIYGDQRSTILDEDLPLRSSVIQLNDYAITKWVNEKQIMNFEKLYGNRCVRLRLFNTYGPGEYYHKYRSVVAIFCYCAICDIPYTVYRNYHRVFVYLDDVIPTIAKVCERFNSGQVYNLGGQAYRSIEDLSSIVLNYLKKDDRQVTYLEEDLQNVVNKKANIERTRIEFGYNPSIPLEVGIPKTIDWMKKVYCK